MTTPAVTAQLRTRCDYYRANNTASCSRQSSGIARRSTHSRLIDASVSASSSTIAQAVLTQAVPLNQSVDFGRRCLPLVSGQMHLRAVTTLRRANTSACLRPACAQLGCGAPSFDLIYQL